MNAINFKATEIKATEIDLQETMENILSFPNRYEARENKREAKEITVVPWVNSRNEIMHRNYKAKQYIQECKQKSAHDDFWCLLSAISVFATIFAAYFLLCLF